MSFRCQNCNKVIFDRANKVVKEFRDVNYNHFIPRNDQFLFQTKGKEIVKEEYWCEECMEQNLSTPIISKEKVIKNYITDNKRVILQKENTKERKLNSFQEL